MTNIKKDDSPTKEKKGGFTAESEAGEAAPRPGG